MVELVDTQDLGSCDASRGGSSPSARTIEMQYEETMTNGVDIWKALGKKFNEDYTDASR